MKSMYSIYEIVKARERGWSIAKISRELQASRNTVKRYLKIYDEYLKTVDSIKSDDDLRKAIDELEIKVKYDSSNRRCGKYTKEIDNQLRKILKDEKQKDELLGPNHKQSLTMHQIYELIVSLGYDISETTIRNKIKEIRNESKKVFIRQDYELGQRLEYDFGEVKLIIDGKNVILYLAVLASPGSGFRWAYIYHNSKMEVFIDSHSKFFEHVKGVYKEVVYDNMKNVIAKFVGRNEKEINKELLKMSLYYGFDINVTNTYSGNEKGYVEGSVKYLRNKIFATKYKFDSFIEVEEYLIEKLNELNMDSLIDEEKKVLLPYKFPYESAVITNNVVDKYSFIHVDNNSYSVPEALMGKTVTVKLYPETIIVAYNSQEVAKHKRMHEKNKMCVDIRHYLHTLMVKPGAIKNSLALKSEPKLKKIFDLYYKNKPKYFIELLRENSDKSIDELIKILTPNSKTNNDNLEAIIKDYINEQISSINNLFVGGDKKNVH